MVEFCCLNILPRREMQRYYNAILNKSGTKMIPGKKHNRNHGSKFRIFYNVWQKSGDIYFCGSHSDFKSLSIYRPT